MPLTCRGPRAAVAPTRCQGLPTPPGAKARRQRTTNGAAAAADSLTAGQTNASRRAHVTVAASHHQVPRRAGQGEAASEGTPCPALPCPCPLPRRARDSVTAAALALLLLCGAAVRECGRGAEAACSGTGRGTRWPRAAPRHVARAALWHLCCACSGGARWLAPSAGCRHLQFGSSARRSAARPRSRTRVSGSCWGWKPNGVGGGWVPGPCLDCWHCRLVGPESDGCTVDQAGGPAARGSHLHSWLGELPIRGIGP